MTEREWIPNIDLGEDYDRRYRGANFHYDRLRNLADHFGRNMPVHRHAQSYQLHLIDCGAVRFHIEDQLFEVSGPCLFYTPAAVPHAFQVEASATGHVLTVHQSFIWRLWQQSGDTELDFALSRPLCLTAHQVVGDGDEAQWARLVDCVVAIRDEWQHAQIAGHYALESLVGLLLIQMARLSTTARGGLATNNEDLKLYHRFVREVEKHYREHWPLRSYLDAMGVSERRLNGVCQRISHTTPKQLIRERLLNEARRLLTLTGQHSNEIAYALGFSDPAYFSRFFRRYSDMTPLQFRRQGTPRTLGE